MTTPEGTRDPRTEPRTGDVLRNGKYERHVGLVTRITHVAQYRRRNPALNAGGFESFLRSCSLRAWCEWAKDAEVIYRAEDAE